MYIPKLNAMTDKAEIIGFMKQYSFATLITAQDNVPSASHLPFIIEEREDSIFLISHFAKANPQWEEITQNQVLVIFTEPHAYISPQHYDHELNVPTWNYLAVHAYGQGRLITEQVKAFAALETMINTYEAAYQTQWQQLPPDFKTKLLNRIVAFEIEITDLQAKKKLSRNKSSTEKQRIITALENSPHGVEKEIGQYMQKEYY
ncbi:FMN-binding negative transcriptional regulator [Adhaeribacter swui]|uniref:FMN-binding negative transcriptional regulator n=1 Tax=Adhaeribacter swui TaxID=2086471 RepID=A0A7G7GEB1_9BACT|nr:FMN-binding negative transcriptional regulator [Adhaeribacter swui]QNF35495.1 FMN-binding negative transcriptional regulator [Adhaeribacter swui]